MKTVVDSYIGIWLIMFFLLLCIAFTSINMNVIQARKMFNDIKAQVQASNGSFVPRQAVDAGKQYNKSTHKTGVMKDEFYFDSIDPNVGADKVRSIRHNNYQYNYTVTRKQLAADAGVTADNEAWIYNDIYLIEFNYMYLVPIFGYQMYPIVGYTY